MLVPRPLALIVCSIAGLLGGLDQQIEDLWRKGRAAPDRRPRSKWMAANLLLIDSRGVGGVGDIDSDCDVGPHLEGRGPGAEQADLLLDSGDGGETSLQAAALVAAAQSFQRDVGARVGCPSSGRPAGRPLLASAPRDHDGVAYLHQLRRCVAVGGADVDVQPFQLHHLLALVGVEQMDRLAPDDAGDGAVLAPQLDPLADQDLRVPAADRGEPEESLLVDVGDEEPDLVDVADDREQRCRPADPGDRGSERVAAKARRTRPPRARLPPPGPRSLRAQRCAAVVEQFGCLLRGRQYVESNKHPR